MNLAWNDISLRYEFHVLDNAFLVHSPGVKTAKERDMRIKPAKANIEIFLFGKFHAQTSKTVGVGNFDGARVCKLT